MTLDKSKPKSKNPVEVTEEMQNVSFPLLRFLGYILLIFSVVDYLAFLIPPQLTNPVWEFQTIGKMVDHVWSILLGLIFIFLYAKGNIIKPRELTILKYLSWVSLVVGIFYILLLPLGINNSLTIYRNINNQFLTQQGQRQEQVQKTTERLEQTNSTQALNNLARALNVPNESGNSQSPQELKSKLSQQIQKIADNSTATAKSVKTGQINRLIKTSVRINLGVIIAGGSFITIWNMTRWIRVINKNIR
jgi:hypothetical protein